MVPYDAHAVEDFKARDNRMNGSVL
jgi:hypothetical protein